jgi:hypothetical protein
VRRALEQHAILLESDARLPSVSALVAGAPVRGSWWGHPQGGIIYEVAGWLAAQSDVLVCKLVSGKVSYVHRSLWSACFAVATAREPWQTQGLSRAALNLLAGVQREGELRTDDLPWFDCGAHGPTAAAAARELEKKLLVHAAQVHTDKGFHAKSLESWEHWARRASFHPRPRLTARARRELERVLGGLNRRFEADARLPWSEQ